MDVVRVFVQLCLKHLVGGLNVAEGRMRIDMVLAAVVEIGSRESAFLHFMIDDLDVDLSRLVDEIGDYSNSVEFLGKHRDVEIVGVEAGDVRADEVVGDFLSLLAESRAVGDIRVRDAVHLGGSLGDVHLRVDKQTVRSLFSIRKNLDVCDFDDTVACDFEASGLQVEDDERTFKIEFHIMRCFKFCKGSYFF